MKILKTILFWLISCTWGLPMTLFGAVGALALLITGHRPHRFHHYIYFEVGESWGGLEAGPFFFTDKNSSYDTRAHEAGHGLQNILLGPLMPFIVSIPSATRYWLFCRDDKINTVVGAILLLFFAFACISMFIINLYLGMVLIIYAIYLLIFYLAELRKLATDCTYSYYSIWFERIASDWGKKYFPKVD